MLGIILAILKFIGWLLLGILLLILGIVAVVLLSPIGYRVAGEKREALKGDFSVRWLFGILRVDGRYIDGKTELSVKLLWFSLLGEKKEKKKKRRKKEKAPKPVPQRKKEGAVLVVREKAVTPAEIAAPPKEEPPKEETVKEESIQEKAAEEETKPRVGVRRVKLSEIEEKPYIPPTQDAFEEEESFFTGEKESPKIEKLREYWRKFQAIEGKKEILLALKQLLKRLIRGILPKDIRIQATLGTGDPELTGYMMALFGILTAKFGDNIQIKADFTRLVAEDILVAIKGKIVLGSFLFALVAFILKKPIRKILWSLWKGRSKNG